MRQPTVFIICGFARTGKDTLGQAILDLIPHSRKVAFADPLKSAANLFLERLSLHGMCDFNREQDKFRFRDFLVAGGKMARAIDPEVFASRAAYDANMLLLAGRCVVITDWRYANELVAVQTKCAPHKVVTVRLHRESTGPANEEEAVHMAQIEDTCRLDHEASFKSGEVGLIKDLAFLLASRVPEVPAA